ncbi:MAG: low temperature requirement protein A [Actinomycetota bacterium]|nr:low temperature requirement protein A [Actinomycetota bacterium]
MSDSGRWRAARREEERVTPLELFFDLVFVLAITQCTALMASEPTWHGLGKGLLILGVLWWAWVGYAWLTSVVDPEEGAVRLAMFAAMAAFLVVALCVPRAFENLGLTFAIAYGLVRVAHIALFLLASRNDPALRQSVTGLAISSAIGVGLLVGAAFVDGAPQGVLWVLALLLDAGGPFVFGAEGWKLVPGHFAERHGLIVLIALGESIVAIGVGSAAGVTAGVITAAVLGMALAAGMWWAYFDVVAYVAARRLASLPEGRKRNEMARDSYSYLHFPMVASIVLVALGLKQTLLHLDGPLALVPAVALIGGVALYLLSHVAFRFRNFRTINKERLIVALVLLALLPLGTEVSALASLAVCAGLLCLMITYEAVRFSEARNRVRHELHAEPPAP